MSDMTEADGQVLPPNDRGAERGLIGTIYRDNRAYDDVQKLVRADDFYSFAHRVIFEHIVRLIASGKPADPVTLADSLHAAKQLDDAGGYAYITDLWDGAPTIGNVAHYAEIVRRKSLLRHLIHSCGEIARQAWEPSADPAEIAARAETLIYNINQSRRTGEIITFDQAVMAGLEALDQRSGRSIDGECDRGIKYGLPMLDSLTGGLHPRELIILAARPSVGKTLVAMAIIANIASEGGRVFFASIEQSHIELAHRELSKKARVSSGKFRNANFTAEDREAIDIAASAIRGWKLWLNDNSNQSVADIASDARRLQMRHGLDLIVVDYLQIVKTENARASRNEAVGNVSWRLKQLAKELNVPVVCLSQLNRGVESRGPDAEPRLSDLRESGEIEQNADTVIFLHKTEDPDQDRTEDILKLLIRKQRNGPLGDVTTKHYKKIFEVKEMAAFP
jgi:replicative DNA helicase